MPFPWDALGEGPDLAATVAALLTETGLSPVRDLPHLTDYQIHCLYYHPRDKEGKVLSRKGQDRLPDRDDDISEEEAARIHFSFGAMVNIPRDELERTWLANHDSIPPGV